MPPVSSIWIPGRDGHHPWIIQRVRTRQAAQPGNAGAEPAAAARAAKAKGGCGGPVLPPPYSGTTLSEEGGQGERTRTRRSA